MTDYELVIGMETHVELDTQSKMFCTCSARFFGAEPNLNTCPVCTGMPGALPAINPRAVEFTLMLGAALSCKINQHTLWERKSYWYPDLPKGYQLTQYQFPTCYDGFLDVDVRDWSGGWNEQSYRKRIRIRRAHLEEDTGKLTHAGKSSYVDYNRSGVPLLEIVTEPDINTPDEAFAFLVALQGIVRYLAIATGDMEKGAMRCEPNISVRPKGSAILGTKVEVKNLNSFRVVREACAYEFKRQIAAIERGEKVRQVTMGWDDTAQRSVVQREKEDAHDYRYFPDPDLPPLDVSDAWLTESRRRVPALALARQDRYKAEFGVNAYDAHILTQDRAVAEYFEAAVGDDAKRGKAISNFVTGELFRLMRAHAQELGDVKIKPAHINTLAALVENGAISNSGAKIAFEEMFASGDKPEHVVEHKGLAQVSDSAALQSMVKDVLSAHAKEARGYLDGNIKLLQFLVGQTMKMSKGKANPAMIQELMKAELEKLR